MSNDTSSDPIIAGRQPETVTLTKGDEYVWCACGRSRTQPFCDGSHAGTGFQPVAFRATESGGAALCMCEHTHGAPYCDGTHATLPRDESAKTEPSLPAAAPGIPALARARHYLDTRQSRIALIVTGGLRMPEDFVKALCLGADGGALANSAIQAVGCIAARVCNTNNCPAGVATQKPELRARLDVARGAQRLTRFLEASTQLMQVLARACGHSHLNQFDRSDITTWKKEMADLTGIQFAGFVPAR